MLPSREDMRDLPVFAPLFAAILAPLSTLLDIPGLSEPWFFQADTSTGQTHALPDPRANLVLSAVGLSFNVLANALLIVRFSIRDGYWRVATRVSLVCWIVKLGIGFGNVLSFGILSRNDPGISYGEAFWCAVVSLLISAVIVFFLLSHYFLLFRKGKGLPQTDLEKEVRIAGRHFMLQNTLFISTIGILALFMSRVEKWTYLQGIYFSVVSFLTIGFGDFYPTKAVTQIVLFPFLLVGIVQLASLIDLIVRFFHARLAARHDRRHREFEKRRQEEEDALSYEPDFERELEFLRRLYTQSGKWKTAQDLVMNCAGFLVFWVLGALIFSQIEAWTYGQGLFFCYVFFFAVGYGDFAPITPAGRVVFIIYSLLAVPIMSSLAVQTIEVIFKQTSTKILHREQVAEGVGDDSIDIDNINEFKNARAMPRTRSGAADEEKQLPEDVRRRLARNDYRKSHSDFITEEHKRIELRLSKSGFGLGKKAKGDADNDAEKAAEDRERDREREEDRILTEYVLELAVELEKHARRLLMGHMDEGSVARMLLKADRNVQLRNIRTLAEQEQEQDDEEVDAVPNGGAEHAEHGSEHEHQETAKKVRSNAPTASTSGRKPTVNAMMRKYYEEEADLMPFPSDISERETLEEVARYREAFAGLLAAGSRLMRLKDKEKCFFERQLWKAGGERG